MRFQYPGQLPWMPVYNGANRHVVGGDFIPWQWLQDKGAITVSFDGQTIINTTKETHIFHQGDIYRTISKGTVTTEGYGTNTSPLVAAMNQYLGPVAFEVNDRFMLTFSTYDQISGERLMPLMDAVASYFDK